jgi:hypothetical protein
LAEANGNGEKSIYTISIPLAKISAIVLLFSLNIFLLFRFIYYSYFVTVPLINRTMKAPAKSTEKKIGTKKTTPAEEIHADFPLSEKDEVKQAEKKLKDLQKKQK